jgi:hypothetical protein
MESLHPKMKKAVVGRDVNEFNRNRLLCTKTGETFRRFFIEGSLTPYSDKILIGIYNRLKVVIQYAWLHQRLVITGLQKLLKNEGKI